MKGYLHIFQVLAFYLIYQILLIILWVRGNSVHNN